MTRSDRARVLLSRLRREIAEDDVLGNAAKLAFYAFLSLPPALMALFGAAGLLESERFAVWLERHASVALPPAVVGDILRPFIQDVVLREAPGPFSIGLVLALWGGSNVFAGLAGSLNVAFDVQESRPWLRKRALALATMLGSVVFFVLAAIALLAGSALAGALGLRPAARVVWSVVQWPLSFAFVVAAFWLGYYILPNRDQSRCKMTLLKAAAGAALLWVAATAAFRLYIANFGSYSETYGFLGAFIVLLLWLYMTAAVVLVGGEVAAELNRGG